MDDFLSRLVVWVGFNQRSTKQAIFILFYTLCFSILLQKIQIVVHYKKRVGILRVRTLFSRMASFSAVRDVDTGVKASCTGKLTGLADRFEDFVPFLVDSSISSVLKGLFTAAGRVESVENRVLATRVRVFLMFFSTTFD